MNFARPGRVLLILTFLATSPTGLGQDPEPAWVVTIVDGDGVILRSAPVQSPDNVLETADRGARFLGVSEESEWYRVRLHDGRLAWLHRDYGDRSQVLPDLEVTGASVRVRAMPHSEAPVVAGVGLGDRVAQLAVQDDWTLVVLAGGRQGWIFAELVTESTGVSDLPAVQDPDGSPSEPRSEAQPAGEAGREATPQEEPVTGQVEDAREEAVPSTEGEVSDDLSSLPADALSLGEMTQPAEESVSPPEGESLSSPHRSGTGGEGGSSTVFLSGTIPVLLVAAFACGGLAGYFLQRWRVRRVAQAVAVGRRRVAASATDMIQVLKRLDERQQVIDSELHGKFETLRTALSGTPPEELETQLLARLDEMRLTIRGQRQRLDLYSDLLAAQGRKLEIMSEENKLLRKLLTPDV